jgi:AAA+ ATPase superfamily predicted ATPase
MKNPFADYGTTVTGNRFIGRKEEIQAVKNRIFDERYGNLAIMGLPRIGKMSLARQAIIEYQTEFPQEPVLAVWVSMGTIVSSLLFYEIIVHEVTKKLLLYKSLDKKVLTDLLNQICELDLNIVKKKL